VQLQAYERVVAPFAGVITAAHVDPGALVGPAGGVSATLPAGTGSAPGSLFTIAQTDTLSVYVTVPEDYAAAVAIGKHAVITVPALPATRCAGVWLVPRDRSMPPPYPCSRKCGWRIQREYSCPGCMPRCSLHSARARRRCAVPPPTALVIRDGPPQVVTVAADSTARYQTVTIGRDLGSWVEVTAGLAQGMRIVINPPGDLQDGARVRVVTADSTSNRERGTMSAKHESWAGAAPGPLCSWPSVSPQRSWVARAPRAIPQCDGLRRRGRAVHRRQRYRNGADDEGHGNPTVR